jgi:hypothetical protein
VILLSASYAHVVVAVVALMSGRGVVAGCCSTRLLEVASLH